MCTYGKIGRSSVSGFLSRLAAGVTLVLLAASLAWAGDTGYNPKQSNQTINQGESSPVMEFTVTAPVLPAGKNKPDPYATCVTANILVKDMHFTDLSIEPLEPVAYDFSSWFTLDPEDFCFANAGETLKVSVQVHVPFDAPVGQYDAKVAARGPVGIGWGEGSGFHISLQVIDPTPADSTPPVVTILQPEEQQKFILGDRVPVEFTAVDEESDVTAWTAHLLPGPMDISGVLSVTPILNGLEMDGWLLSAVPGGAEEIQSIGLYTLSATATSEGGTSAPATRDFTVNYHMEAMAPHLASLTVWDKSENAQGQCWKNGGKSMQIKFTALAVQPADTASVDNSLEKFVRDESVLVEVSCGGSIPTIREFISGGSQDGSVKISGNTGDDSGTYRTDVNLCGMTNGSCSIKVYFFDHSDGDFLQYQKNFTLQD